MRAEAEATQATIVPLSALRVFSKPEPGGKNLSGYDGTYITDDLISDVFSKFNEQTRQKESEESMRTKSGKSCRPRFEIRFQLPFMVTVLDFFLPAVTLSLDATFRTASKATVVNDSNARTKLFTGGLHSVINEDNLILAFVSYTSSPDIVEATHRGADQQRIHSVSAILN